MNLLKSGFLRLCGLVIILAVVWASLSLKNASASTSPFQSVDIIANSAAVAVSGRLLEACVLTVQGNTYPMQLGSCKELGEGVLQQLQRDYPGAVFNLTVNGRSYNTV